MHHSWGTKNRKRWICGAAAAAVLALGGTAQAAWTEDGSVQTLAQLKIMETPANADQGASRETAASMIHLLSGQESTHVSGSKKALGIGLGTITVQEYAAQLLHMLGYSTHEVLNTPILEQAVEKTFDLRPAAIIRDLDLRRPIYASTAAIGHFGVADRPWEQTDLADELKALAGL